jgi:tetratricopeptide (TPR) repeat protein
LERILALPGAKIRDVLRVRALGALGGILYWQNDFEAMRDAYEEAVEIARAVGEPRLLARALFDLSFVPSVTARNFERQEQLLGKALAQAPEDDRVLRAEIGGFLGVVALFRGGDPAAVLGSAESIETLIAIHRERGDRVSTADNLFRLAGLKLFSGDSGAAWEHLRESVALRAQAPPSPATLAADTYKGGFGFWSALAGSSFLASHDGDHKRAARLLGALNRITEGAGAPPPAFLTQFGDPEGAARAALGDEAFEHAHAEGYAMTVDQARFYASEAAARPDR